MSEVTANYDESWKEALNEPEFGVRSSVLGVKI
jgi:hypothetical protein